MRRPFISKSWLLAALVLLITTMVAAACRPVAPPAAGAATAATPAPVATVSASAAAPDPATDWARIQAAQAIVVGTSAIYPPFESYNDTFQIDGFDPALMRALAEQLGLTVVFKDIAFDGLGSALALGQIDAAISAITMTPARAAQVDFTKPYFATTEGYLVRADADVKPLTSGASLAGLRIGAERGSIYENWLRTLLVDPGTIRSQDLILYTTLDKAVNDLNQQRIDVVVTDLLAAEAAAQKSASGGKAGLKVASDSLFNQEYALAVRKDSSELRTQLDQALVTLQQNGVLATLAEQYLGVTSDQLAPLSNQPVAAGMAAAAAACLDGMAFIEDLSLPDQAMTAPAVMVPAQPFTKAWRVQNIGTCAWDSRYGLTFAYGNAPGASMGGAPVAIQGTVEPGATYDIEASLGAPIASGTYQGVWQMHNALGRLFGEGLRVGLQVAGAPTPTPAATQTPAPGITFYADAGTVRQGSPVGFFWDVQDAKDVYFYIAGQDWQGEGVDAKGSATDIPNATTTFNLRVVRNDGQEEVREITVYVEPAPSLPQINYFAVTPGGTMAPGQCVTIAWQIGGDVDQVAVFRNKETIWDGAPVEGSFEDCPTATGAYEYGVGAKGLGGVNYAVETVQVVEGNATPAPAGPIIDIFAVLPAAIQVGECVEVKWNVGGDVTTIRIQRDDVVLFDQAPKSGNGADCPTTAGQYRYQLAASNDQGQTANAEILVDVGMTTATPVPGTPAPATTPAASSPTSLPALSATAAPSAAAAPAPDASDAAAAASGLVDQPLILISYRDAAGALAPPLTGTQVTARFDNDGTLSGLAGCNNYSGAYQVTGATLSLAPIAATMKFCGEPIGVMDQEAQYLSALQTAAGFHAENGQLTLLDGAGTPVALYVASR